MITRRPVQGFALLLVMVAGCGSQSPRAPIGPATGGHRAPPRGAVVARLSRVAGSRVETMRAALPALASPAESPATPPAGSRPPPRDWLVTAGGEVRTPVGLYRDCQGLQPLTHQTAAIDVCITDRTYFVGHNPGVFTPLMLLGVGSVLVWFDHAGAAHPMRIVGVRVWRGPYFPPVIARGIVAQFQTCIDVGGSLRRILDAVAA